METQGSVGARVPSAKSEMRTYVSENNNSNNNSEYGRGQSAKCELDKDFLCPICMQTIKDAFLTACGHSFCYMCIMTHLSNKSNCPCCGLYLTNNQLFPNFLLNKLLKKTLASQIASTASPTEHLRLSLQQGVEVSVKDLDCLLALLAEKKRKMEQEEAETNMEILLNFLQRLRQQKQEELNEVQADLQYIKEDISAVERQRMELSRARERYSLKLRMLLDEPIATTLGHAATNNPNNGSATIVRSGQGGAMPGKFPQKKAEINTQTSSQVMQMRANFCGPDSQNLSTPSGLTIARKRRVLAQFDDLQECYLQKRRRGVYHLRKQCDSGLKKDREGNILSREGYHAGLEDFQSVLTTFTRYSRLRVIAELRHGDLFHSANIVSRRCLTGAVDKVPKLEHTGINRKEKRA